jgi:class 3 adenylate cyclase
VVPPCCQGELKQSTGLAEECNEQSFFRFSSFFALTIQRSLTELNRKNDGAGKPALAARIAIDTGPVVVDASGEIFGDVPNVAARAQALAEPSAVVVTARVQRPVAGLFVAEERGSHALKGVPELVTLSGWCARAAAGAAPSLKTSGLAMPMR